MNSQSQKQSRQDENTHVAGRGSSTAAGDVVDAGRATAANTSRATVVSARVSGGVVANNGAVVVGGSAVGFSGAKISVAVGLVLGRRLNEKLKLELITGGLVVLSAPRPLSNSERILERVSRGLAHVGVGLLQKELVDDVKLNELIEGAHSLVQHALRLETNTYAHKA